MSYRIIIKALAKRQMKKLDARTNERLDEPIRELAVDPYPNGVSKLKSRKGNVFRIRVGNYRVVYTVDDQSKIVKIESVAPRSKPYRK